MIKILLLENELLLAEDLKLKLENLGYSVIGIAISGEEAISMVNKQSPDIALLDIDIDGEMDGLEVGSYLRKAHQIPVIYLTQFKDLQTFDKAKKVNPSSYLTKPVNIWDLVRAVELSLSNHSVGQSQVEGEYLLPKAFYLKGGEGAFQKVPVSDILYLKASGAYTEIYTKGKKFLFSDNLSFFERKLLTPELVRVHRSWIVNVEQVDSIEEMHLIVESERIPVGKTYKNVIKKYFKLI